MNTKDTRVCARALSPTALRSLPKRHNSAPIYTIRRMCVSQKYPPIIKDPITLSIFFAFASAFYFCCYEFDGQLCQDICFGCFIRTFTPEITLCWIIRANSSVGQSDNTVYRGNSIETAHTQRCKVSNKTAFRHKFGPTYFQLGGNVNERPVPRCVYHRLPHHLIVSQRPWRYRVKQKLSFCAEAEGHSWPSIRIWCAIQRMFHVLASKLSFRARSQSLFVRLCKAISQIIGQLYSSQ